MYKRLFCFHVYDDDGGILRYMMLWYDLSDWNESDIELWDPCLIWERCRDEGTFCDLDLLEVDGGDSPLLGRGLGLGRSARDSGALELSEACSLFESVLKAESSKDELSNDTKTQIHADKLNKVTITKTQSTDNLSLFCCCFFKKYSLSQNIICL